MCFSSIAIEGRPVFYFSCLLCFYCWLNTIFLQVQYLLMMMTSWAIVCDVWYLPPMQKLPDEDAAVFAARVKNEIAKKGGLVELDWDGQLKRQQVKVEWKHLQQKIYSERIKFE